MNKRTSISSCGKGVSNHDPNIIGIIEYVVDTDRRLKWLESRLSSSFRLPVVMQPRSTSIPASSRGGQTLVDTRKVFEDDEVRRDVTAFLDSESCAYIYAFTSEGNSQQIPHITANPTHNDAFRNAKKVLLFRKNKGVKKISMDNMGEEISTLEIHPSILRFQQQIVKDIFRPVVASRAMQTRDSNKPLLSIAQTQNSEDDTASFRKHLLGELTNIFDNAVIASGAQDGLTMLPMPLQQYRQQSVTIGTTAEQNTREVERLATMWLKQFRYVLDNAQPSPLTIGQLFEKRRKDEKMKKKLAMVLGDGGNDSSLIEGESSSNLTVEGFSKGLPSFYHLFDNLKDEKGESVIPIGIIYPLDEINHWKLHLKNVTQLVATTKSPMFLKCLSILEENNSKYHAAVESYALQIEDHLYFVESTNKWLKPLIPFFESISPQGKLVKSVIVEELGKTTKIGEVFYILYLLWEHNEWYPSSYRLASIMAGLNEYIITLCTDYLELEKYFINEMDEVKSRITMIFHVCNKLKAAVLYFKQKATGAGRTKDANDILGETEGMVSRSGFGLKTWNISHIQILAHLDQFMERLNDLLDVLNARQMFDWLVNSGISGVEGCRLQNSIIYLVSQFEKELKIYIDAALPALSNPNSEFDDLTKGRLMNIIQTIEVRITAEISAFVEITPMGKSLVERVRNFDEILLRPNTQYHRKQIVITLCNKWKEEINTVRKILSGAAESLEKKESLTSSLFIPEMEVDGGGEESKKSPKKNTLNTKTKVLFGETFAQSVMFIISLCRRLNDLHIEMKLLLDLEGFREGIDKGIIKDITVIFRRIAERSVMTFENVFQLWSESLPLTISLLSSPIFRFNSSRSGKSASEFPRQLEVVLDHDITVTIREAGILYNILSQPAVRELFPNLEYPESGVTLLNIKPSIWKWHTQLQNCVDEYNAICRSLRSHEWKLLANEVTALEATFTRGTCITWKSIEEIDGFIEDCAAGANAMTNTLKALRAHVHGLRDLLSKLIEPGDQFFPLRNSNIGDHTFQLAELKETYNIQNKKRGKIIEATKKYLSEVSERALETVNSIRSSASEHIKEDDPNWKEFMDFIDHVVMEGARSFIMVTYGSLNFQLDPEWIRKNDSMPLIEIRLEVDNKYGICVVPELHTEVHLTMLYLKEDPVRLIETLMPTKERCEALKQALSSDTQLSSFDGQISNTLNNSWSGIGDIIASLSQFEKIWSVTMVSDIEKELNTGNTPVYKISLDKIRKRIEQYKYLSTHVNSIQNRNIILGWLIVNCRGAKSTLKANAQKCLELYINHIHSSIRKSLTYAGDFTRKAKATFNIDLNTLDGDNSKSTREIFQVINSVRNNEQTIMDMFNPMVHGLRFLISLNAIPKEEVKTLNEEMEKREREWQHTVSKGVALREQLTGVYDREISLLKNRISAFETNVLEVKRDAFLNSPICSSIVHLDEPYEMIDAAYKMWNTEIKKEAEALLADQQMYEVELSQFEILTSTLSDIKHAKALWDASFMATLHVGEWMTKLFIEVDTELLVDETRKISRYFNTSLSNRVRKWKAFIYAEKRLNKVITSIPLIQDLTSRALRSRHWDYLLDMCTSYNLLNKVDPTSPSTTLGDLISLDLHMHAEFVAKLVEKAEKEMQTEVLLDQIEVFWCKASLASIKSDHGRNFSILGPVDSLRDALEENVNQLQILHTSRWADYFMPRVEKLRQELSIVDTCLGLWVEIQKRWNSLYPIFTFSKDMRAAIPQDTAAFDCIHQRFVQLCLMTFDSEKSNEGATSCISVISLFNKQQVPSLTKEQIDVLHLSSELQIKAEGMSQEIDNAPKVPGLLAVEKALSLKVLEGSLAEPSRRNHSFETAMSVELEIICDVLRRCEISLATYLEAKRQVFPRLFFVSDTDLIFMLSKADHPPMVCSCINKIVLAIDHCVFTEPENDRCVTIVSVVSVEGEILYFPVPFICEGNVEVWLNNLMGAIHDAVRVAVVLANTNYTENPRTKWMFQHCAQAVSIVSRVHWTAESTVALEAFEDGNASALGDHLNHLKAQLVGTIEAVGWDLNPCERKALITIITIDVHARDIVLELIVKHIDTTTSFTWQKQLRFYFGDVNKQFHIASRLHQLSTNVQFTSFENFSASRDAELTECMKELRSVDLCIGQICDTRFVHGFEYNGNCGCLVVTPLTDRCYITLTQALKLHMGGAPAGPAGTGKTETVKDIAHALGFAVYVFNCSDQMDYMSVGAIFKGLAMSGSWGCLDEFNRIAVEVLSVIGAQMKSILDACRRKSPTFTILGEKLILKSSVGLFITMNPGYKGRTELPENVKVLFRPCAMAAPDIGHICEIMLSAEGFIYAKELAKKFVRLYQMNSEVLSSQAHYDWGLRAIRGVLLIAGSLKRSKPDASERSILLSALRDVNLAKLAKGDVHIFERLLASLFPGVEDAAVKDISLEADVHSVCLNLNYSMGDKNVVITKIHQLFDLINVRHSLFILGPAGSGKSSLLNIAQKTLENRQHANVTVEYFDPKAITAHELYGWVIPQTREWRDGVLSRTFREFSTETRFKKGSQWIVIDGTVDSEWIESMNSVMDDNKLLTLANNERIVMTSNMRLIFEITHLQHATLATVSRAGILHVCDTDIGWIPMKERWISTKLPESFKTHIDILFDNNVQIFLTYCTDNPKTIVPMTPYAYIRSLCDLLEALLSPETSPFGGKIGNNNDKIFLWACIWTFGSPIIYRQGVIDYRSQFSQFVRREFGDVLQLPANGLVYDYCLVPIDDGQNLRWCPWIDTNQIYNDILRGHCHLEGLDQMNRRRDDGVRMTLDITPSHDVDRNIESYLMFSFNPSQPLSDMIIPNIDTERHGYLINILCRSGKHVSLIGYGGTGKSTMTRYLSRRSHETAVMTEELQKKLGITSSEEINETIGKKQHIGKVPYISAVEYQYHIIHFNGLSDSYLFQKQMEEQLEKRVGRQFGPISRKKMIIVIENLNLPIPDKYGSQSSLALLRQHIDRGFWYDRVKLTLKQVMDQQYIAIMNPNVGFQPTPDRLMYKFFTIGIGAPEEDVCIATFKTLLQMGLNYRNVKKDIVMLMLKSVSCIIELLGELSKKFLHTAASFHYSFTMRDISRVFQGLLCMDETTKLAAAPMIWLFQLQAVFCDRMASLNDAEVALKMILSRTSEYFTGKIYKQVDLSGKAIPNLPFETLAEEADGSYSPISPYGTPLNSFSDVLPLVDKRMKVLNIHSGNLILFDQALIHIIRIARILCYPGGNALLIGISGSGKRSLATLASKLSLFELFSIRSGCTNMEFNNDISRIVLNCTQKNSRICALISENDNITNEMLSIIDEFISQRHMDSALSIDLKEELRTKMSNELRIAGDIGFKDASTCRELYMLKMTNNFRVVLTLSPTVKTLRTIMRTFPSFQTQMQIIFFHEWPEDALVCVSEGVISHKKKCNDGNSVYFIDPPVEENQRDFPITENYIQGEGNPPKENENSNMLRAVCEYLASCHIMASRNCIKLLETHQKHAFVTPKTFLTFVDYTCELIMKRRRALHQKQKRLSGGLHQLERCRDQINILKVDLKEFEVVMKEKAVVTRELLEKVSIEREIVESQNNIALNEEAKTNRIVAEVDALVEECAADLKAAEPIVVGARAALNTLDKNNLTELKSMARPPDEVKTVLACVMCLLASGGRIPTDRSWNASRRMMQDVSKWKKRMEDMDYNNISQASINEIWKDVHEPNFDPEAIKSKSLAASSLCRWVVNVVKFHGVRVMVRPKEERLDEATNRLGFSKAHLKKVQNKVAMLKAKLNSVERQYQDAVEESNMLEQQLANTELKVQRAQRLMISLGGEKTRWEGTLDILARENKVVDGDSLIAASFVSYAGPFPDELREEMINEMRNTLKSSRGCPIPFSETSISHHDDKGDEGNGDKRTISPVTNNTPPDPVYMIFNDIDVAKWDAEGLPNTRQMYRNAAISLASNLWPLVIDPQYQAFHWIQGRAARKLINPTNDDGEKCRGNDIVLLRQTDHNFLESIFKAVTSGAITIIDNITDISGVGTILRPLLEKDYLLPGPSKGLLVIGDREVPVHPEFSLFLRCGSSNPVFQSDVFARFSVIDFCVTQKGLEELLLSVIVRRDKPNLEESRVKLANDMNQMTISLLECDNILLEELSMADGDILQNEKLVQTLENAKLQSVEMVRSLKEAKDTRVLISGALSYYQRIASRGSLIYACISELYKVDQMYQYSINAFLAQYEQAIVCAQSSAGARNLEGPQRVELFIFYITRGLYRYISRSLFTKHKFVFAAAIAFNIALQSNLITSDYLNFLIRCPKKLTGPVPLEISDWMTEQQWGSLNALGDIHGPVHPFIRLVDECVETVRWKLWVEHPSPETERLPGDWKELTSFEKLLIIRCLREEKVVGAIKMYVTEIVGRDIFDDDHIQLEKVVRETPVTSPIMFILSPGADPSRQIERAAAAFGMSEQKGNVTIISMGQGQEKGAEQAIRAAAKNGGWVALHNTHLMRKWINQLDLIVSQLTQDPTEVIHSKFRLLLSVEPVEHIPVSLLKVSTKLVDEPPAGLRANFTRAYSLYHSEPWELSTKPQEHHLIVFSMCLFHAIVVERSKFGPAGWNRKYPFSFEDLKTCTDVLSGYLEDKPKIPWEDLRYIFGEIMYGGHITDQWDCRLCLGYLHTFISPEMIDIGTMPRYIVPGIPFPTSRSFSETLGVVNEAFHNEDPTLFFMSRLSENRARVSEAKELFDNLIEFLPRDKNDISKEEGIQLDVLSMVMGAVPERINLTNIIDHLGVDLTPFQDVFYHECERLNRLSECMRDMLDEVEAAIKGMVTMTDDIESFMGELFLDRVPSQWCALWGSTRRPIASWTTLLGEANTQLSNWAMDLMTPKVVNLTCFFVPIAFLTALQQDTAIRTNSELDDVDLIIEITKRIPSEIDIHARDGCYVYGPSLEGASWDSNMNCLQEIQQKDGTRLPVMIVRCAHLSKINRSNSYACPLYRTTARYQTYITTLHLKTTRVPSSIWTLRGAALILDGGY